ncbi:MAG: hypothetical protein R3F29_07825 [Planctomycetota bacterium]
MKGERRRARGLLRAVVDDPYRKLMAIGLAVLMWFIVNNRIQATYTQSLPLVVVGEFFDNNVDQLAVVLGNEQVTSRSFWNGTKEIQNVSITVTGPRFQVDSIRKEPLNLVVRKPQSGGGETVDAESFEFTVADFLPNTLLRDVEIAMDPPRVRLEFKVEESWTVELPPRDDRLIEIAVDPALESRVLRQTASYYPKTLRVVGRGADLAKLELRTVPLFRASLQPSGVTGNKVSARIQLIGANRELRIEPEVTIEMDLLPRTERFTLEVPFLVDDLSLPLDKRGRFEPEQPVRSVPIYASGTLLAELTTLDAGSDHRALDTFGRDNFRLLVPIELPTGGALPDVTTLKAYLIPTGKLLGGRALDRNEFSLAETVTVNLRRKQ